MIDGGPLSLICCIQQSVKRLLNVILWVVLTIGFTPSWAGTSDNVNRLMMHGALAPVPNMDGLSKVDFFAGKAIAEEPWVKAPTLTTARDGLGPLYNARSCLSCHQKGLRGVQPENSNDSLSAIVKLSLPGRDSRFGFIEEPVYGDQLQTRSTDLFAELAYATNKTPKIPAEAQTRIEWLYQTFQYPDGEHAELRKPQLKISNWSYGAPDKKLITSLRNAPNLFGVGLLEMIAADEILIKSDPDDKDGDGISGKPNQVRSKTSGQLDVGRFGWKANRATLEEVNAAAFVKDIGITNKIFRQENCSTHQTLCKREAKRVHPEVELSDRLLELTNFFIEHIAVPKAKPLTEQGQKGGELFTQIGCSSCHHPSYTTQQNADKPFLAEQKIWPYTDLLLHDMGEGLADGREEFEASGSEWRTAPLWGMSADPNLRKGNGYLLHDGRARTIEEAILWHGGEARKVTDAFVNLPQQQRLQLIEFVSSL